jgi:hypothetical protein
MFHLIAGRTKWSIQCMVLMTSIHGMILHLINRAVTSQLKKSGSSENLDSNSGSTLSDYYFLKKVMVTILLC